MVTRIPDGKHHVGKTILYKLKEVGKNPGPFLLLFCIKSWNKHALATFLPDLPDVAFFCSQHVQHETALTSSFHHKVVVISSFKACVSV